MTVAIRTAVLPVLAAFAVFLGVLAYAHRHPDPSGGRRSPPGRLGERLRYLAVTVLGGYGVFLGIVLVFHVWNAGQRHALPSAIRGGGVLASIAALVFGAGTVASSRRA